MVATIDNIVGEATADFVGKDGFFWWVGEVEETKDPQLLGRVKCRVLGYYTGAEAGFRKDLETKDLPWATVLQPTDQPGVEGLGKSSHQLRPGAIVMGFFMDGEEAQFPIVMGVLRISQAKGTTLKGENSTFIFSQGPNREDINPTTNQTGTDQTAGKKLKTANTAVKEAGNPTAELPNAANPGTGLGHRTGIPGSSANTVKPPFPSKPIPAAHGVGGPWKTLDGKLTQLVEDLAATAGSVMKNENGDFVSIIENKVVNMEALLDKVDNFLSSVMGQVVSAFKEQLTAIAGKALSVANSIAKMSGIPFIVLLLVQVVIKILLGQICSLDGLIGGMMMGPQDAIRALVDNIVNKVTTVAEAAISGVQDMIKEVTCAIRDGLGVVSSAIGLIKAATGVAQGFSQLSSIWEDGSDIMSAAQDINKINLESIGQLISLIFSLVDFGGCDRKAGDRATQEMGFWPLLGSTQCSGDNLDALKDQIGDNYGPCGGGGKANLFDSLYADASPYLTAAENFLNGAYNLQLGTPGREATVIRGAGGMTITNTKLDNKVFMKYKQLVDAGMTEEEAEKEAQKQNSAVAPDPLVATHINEPGNMTMTIEGDRAAAIGKNLIETVDGDIRLKCSGDFHLDIGGGMFINAQGAPGKGETKTQKSMVNIGSDFSMDVKGHAQIQGIGTTVAGKGGTQAQVISPQGTTKIDATAYEINAGEIKLSASNSITMTAPVEYHFINTGLNMLIPKAKTGILSTVGGPVDYLLKPAIAGDMIPRFSVNTVGPFLVNCAAGGALFTVAAGGFSVNVAAGAASIVASAAVNITAAAAVNIAATANVKITGATILLT